MRSGLGGSRVPIRVIDVASAELRADHMTLIPSDLESGEQRVLVDGPRVVGVVPTALLAGRELGSNRGDAAAQLVWHERRRSRRLPHAVCRARTLCTGRVGHPCLATR
jgi:hypothetical protein